VSTMDRKGQASAEYLLLIVVILLVMGWLVVNVYQPAVGNTTEVSKTSDASTAVNSIADAVNLVYANGPGAKRTLNVYIPPSGKIVNGNIFVNNALTPKIIGINMTYAGDNGIPENKTVNASIDYNVTLNIIPGSDDWYKVTVEWFRTSPPSPISVTIDGTA